MGNKQNLTKQNGHNEHITKMNIVKLLAFSNKIKHIISQATAILLQVL